MALALAIEFAIILLLLTLGIGKGPTPDDAVSIASFDVSSAPASEPTQQDEPAAQQTASAADTTPATMPAERPAPPASALPAIAPVPAIEAAPAPSPRPVPTPTSRIGAVIRSDMAVGPADTGSRMGADSPVIGTAPDGSPLYAARWYREPSERELSGYLSTASTTGWGLIACKTAPDWRVEQCEILDEYPNGSGIARATRAAAWQFRVRPPRLHGEYQIGSWVRIRIDYTRS